MPSPHRHAAFCRWHCSALVSAARGSGTSRPLRVDQSTPEQKAKTAVWDKNRRFVYSDPRFAQNMGVSSAVETTIPEGTKLEINGFAVVPLGINNPSGGPEANQYSFDLVYDTWSNDESPSRRLTTTQSCKGRNAMSFPSCSRPVGSPNGMIPRQGDK